MRSPPGSGGSPCESLQPFLSAVLVVIIACVLVGRCGHAAPLGLVFREDWNGVHPFQTSTPTLTLLPNQGWWTSIPTAPGLGISRPLP